MAGNAELLPVAMLNELRHWQRWAHENGMTDADYHTGDGIGWISRLDALVERAASEIESADNPHAARLMAALITWRQANALSSGAISRALVDWVDDLGPRDLHAAREAMGYQGSDLAEKPSKRAIAKRVRALLQQVQER